MKKKKNAFTLIELLAIIVILAIVAVITVPLILNVIENAKKGAAKDSAYGYKDAINKYYLSQLADNPNYIMPDDTYTVNGTTGYLVGTETLDIEISGTIPNSGSVELEKNIIKNACLKFGDYAVPITNGEIGNAQKASCNGTLIVATDTEDASSTAGGLLISKSKTQTDQYEPVKITHTNGTIDYRYMGGDPNNYIYFNCEDYGNQSSTTCETWRIIGVFNNKLKIISEKLSDDMEWDAEITEEDGLDTVVVHSPSTNWETSTTKIFLNDTYYNNLNTDTKNIISNSTWNLGNWDALFGNWDFGSEYTYLDKFPEGAYLSERGTSVNGSNPASITANVGLMYPSDYAFASSACYSLCIATNDSSCGTNFGTHHLIYGEAETGTTYSDEECTSTNWLFDPDTRYWTITPFDNGYTNFFGDYQSAISAWDRIEINDIGNSNAIRPTVYLDPTIELTSDENNVNASGSRENPYQIIID